MTRPPRRYWRDHRAVVLWLGCALLVLWRVTAINNRPAGPELLEEGIHQVRRVVDGDTLVLASGARLRLQGIDTPETVKPNHPVEKWGPEAAAFTRDFLDRGEVRLVFDRERQDRYGRFLAYVYVDDRMLNEELVRAGLATAEPGFRYSASMKRKVLAAEAEAKAARRGIWSE